MKNILIILTIGVIGLISCSNVDTDKSNDSDNINTDSQEALLTKIKFDTVNYDFGKIISGEKVAYTFNFKNTGNKDLIISEVKATCGCTVPEWSKDPIKPQEDGNIEVVFNSSGRRGMQRKTISVYANTDPQLTLLTIAADVEEK